ncbi:hypothetical protein [Actinomadura bangladeshensis]|uniref:Uncharacterized protein n=1 Tax=Actinomadura bangladeshensis TaxID=453573 RepID=A0A4V2XJQ0_9ACTN|nr:hypothetical protein [Actinomadura bangladeshensis]TDC03476.1 hypothetical protein E1284_38190 [Actinomadura bangladeshensis]
MNAEGKFEAELEFEVEEELLLAESSRPEETAAAPPSTWLFDPTDVERERIGLRDILGAAEALDDEHAQ